MTKSGRLTQMGASLEMGASLRWAPHLEIHENFLWGSKPVSGHLRDLADATVAVCLLRSSSVPR